jgi:hypothetical protein
MKRGKFWGNCSVIGNTIGEHLENMGTSWGPIGKFETSWEHIVNSYNSIQIGHLMQKQNKLLKKN